VVGVAVSFGMAVGAGRGLEVARDGLADGLTGTAREFIGLDETGLDETGLDVTGLEPGSLAAVAVSPERDR
jgi:hypothetical protein